MNPQPNTPASINEAVAPWDGHTFIKKTNEEYAAWCKTFYVPEALHGREMMSLHGLWAWQEQERRICATLAAPAAAIDAREQEGKTAPVQGWPAGIPWSLHMEAYAAYCKKWRPQSALIEGGCRGGFHVDELDGFIPGWRDKVSEIGKLRAEIAYLRATPSEALSPATVAQPVAYANPVILLPDATGDEEWTAKVQGHRDDVFRLPLFAQPCASQGCGGAPEYWIPADSNGVFTGRWMRSLALTDKEKASGDWIPLVRAALSTAPRSLDGATPGGKA